MDFWAQHKEFVLKILAGFGVFLVAVIARGIVYGEDVDDLQRTNTQLASKIQRLKLAPPSVVATLQQNASRLQQNAAAIADQVGWNASEPDALVTQLIRRTLSYLPRFRDADPATLDAETSQKRQAIKDNLNGGFGELRLLVRDELIDEANVRNIRVTDGIGFEGATDLQPGDLLKYLLQLELVSRLTSYMIEAGVDGIEEIRIEPRTVEAIPGANADFLQEYPVRLRFRSSQPALYRILNRLERESPAVPLRTLRVDRVDRPLDHVMAELTLVALASNTEVPFQAEEKTQ